MTCWGTRYLLCAGVVLLLAVLMPAARAQMPAGNAADEIASDAAAPAPAAEPAAASPDPKKEKPAKEAADQEQNTRRVSFSFKKHPSLRFGNWLNIDFRTKIHFDFRVFDPEVHHQQDGRLLDLRRLRLAVEGTAFKIFEYSVERDIREEASGGEFSGSKHPWKDVFVNVRYFPGIQIQGGHFKLPFGLEALTGSSHLDYVYRSVVSQTLTPARDTGLMVHSHLFERGLHYQFGLFLHDGEGARGKNDIIAGYRTFAGRVTGTPFQLLKLPGFLQSIEFGGAFTESAVPGVDGVYGGLRARTYSKQTFFPDMFVHGHRLRLGAEIKWTPGPFGLKSEFIHVRDQRLGQSMTGGDLPDLIARGWYVSGTWLVTGEKKTDTVVPRRTFLPFHGFGAFEIAARTEQLRLGSSEHPGRPSRSTRAANILGDSDRAWTFGANWYWNRFVRIQFNAMRERIEDPTRAPFGSRDPFWMRAWQLQFVL